MAQAPASRIPAGVWEAQRARIAALYVDQDKTLDEVIQHMADYHGFHASKPQYIRKVTVNWKLRKNSTKEEWEHAITLVSKRKAEGKATQLMMNGKIVSHKKRKKEMRRYPTLQTQQTEHFNDASQAVVVWTPSPSPSSFPSEMKFITCNTLPWLKFTGILSRTLSGCGSYSDLNQNVKVFQNLIASAWSLMGGSAAVNELVETMRPETRAQSMRNAPIRRTLPQILAQLDEKLPKGDGHKALQVHGSPWQQLFYSTAFFSTNNIADILDTDRLLELFVSNGFLQGLKILLAIEGPTTQMLAVRFLFSALKTQSIEYLNLIRFLLRNGLSPNSTFPDVLPYYRNSTFDPALRRILRTSALQEAVEDKNPAAVELLLRFKADPNAFQESHVSESPLNMALNQHNGSSMAEMLIDAGADINYFNLTLHNSNSAPPLLQAIKNKHFECAQHLLREGANPNFVHPLRLTALHGAIDLDNVNMVKALINAGANPDILCLDERVDIILETRIESRCNWMNSEESCRTLSTPIQEAVRIGNVTVIQCLVNAGATLDRFIDPDRYGSSVTFQKSGCIAETPLQLAVKYRNDQIVGVLLNAGADANFRHMTIASPLQMACGLPPSEERKARSVDLLLAWGADINAPPASRGGRTALQAAAEIGDYDLVQVLLNGGASSNAPAAYHEGLTALQAAVKSGSIDVINLVLGSLQKELGLNASTIWRNGTNYLEPAVLSEDMQILAMILQPWTDIGLECPDEHITDTLEAVIKRGSVGWVRHLLNTNANIDLGGNACSIICEAIWLGNDEIFDLLMDHFNGIDLNDTLPGDPTPLWVAMHQDERHMAQHLIQAGADVNMYSPHVCREPASCRDEVDMSRLETPMVSPITKTPGSVEMIKLLVDAGADLSLPIDESFPPLSCAVGGGRWEIAEFLLDNGADPNLRDFRHELNPLSFLLNSDPGPVPFGVFQSFIQHGVDVNASGEAGSPIQMVSKGSYRLAADGTYDLLSVARLFLDAGADLNAPTTVGCPMTALQQAIDNGDVEMVELFLNKGADIHAPAFWKRGKTALQAAASAGNLGLARTLVAQGMDVNAKPATEYGATALQFAAINGHINMAIFLLENGALINAPAGPVEGRTALEGAAENGRLDMIYLLLENDEEPDTVEERCRDAAELAQGEYYPVIAKLLREYKRPGGPRGNEE